MYEIAFGISQLLQAQQISLITWKICLIAVKKKVIQNFTNVTKTSYNSP